MKPSRCFPAFRSQRRDKLTHDTSQHTSQPQWLTSPPSFSDHSRHIQPFRSTLAFLLFPWQGLLMLPFYRQQY